MEHLGVEVGEPGCVGPVGVADRDEMVAREGREEGAERERRGRELAS